MRKHLTAAVIFLVLTLILTNPLPAQVWNAVEDKQDALLNTWILAWVGHALVTNPLELFNTNIFYPYRNTLAYSEVLLPQGLFALPLTLATDNPIFGYNLALLAMLWLDAFGMYLFVYGLTRDARAGWIAGAIYAFNPFNLGNFAQMQLITLGWLPLAFLFLYKILFPGAGRTLSRARAARFGFLLALLFWLQALSSFYYALIGGLGVGLFLLWWLWAQRRAWASAIRRVLAPLAAAWVLIGIGLIPFMLPYFQVQRELGFERRVQESEPGSAYLKQFVEVSSANVLYGSFLAPSPVVKLGGYPLDNLFPGVTALALAVIGLWSAPKSSARFLFLLILVVSFVLALGPRLYLAQAVPTNIILPYRYLYDTFSPLRALRAPVRFDALINFALAGLAGLAIIRLLRRWSPLQGMAPALGVVALIALEYLAIPAAGTVRVAVADEIPNVYKWLAQQPPGVALELPMMAPNANDELDLSPQYFTTYDWQKTPDGYSGFIPPRRGEIAYEMQSFPSARGLALAQALDINWIVDKRGNCPASSNDPSGWPLARVPAVTDACVFQLLPAEKSLPNFIKRLYVPTQVAEGAAFNGYLVLINGLNSPYAVKPTDRAKVQVRWKDGRTENIEFPIPLVTSVVSVAPIPLRAPEKEGVQELRVQGIDPVIGRMDVGAFVNVGNELANQVVIPASVGLSSRLPETIARGETLNLGLVWFVYNKINAYYSASVRLVDDKGNKVSNVDRQPNGTTLLWKPDSQVTDLFLLKTPPDIAPGNYRVEVLMYQPETDQEALLLDKAYTPQATIVLGEIRVR